MIKIERVLVLALMVFCVQSLCFAAPQQKVVVVPEGTSLLVRMVDGVTSRDPAGKIFSAKLEGDLRVGEKTIAPSGSMVYGVLEASRQGGRMAGRSEQTLRLREIMIDGKRERIITSSYRQQGERAGKNTAKNAAIGAGIGQLAKGSSKGTKRGAAVGLGLSALGGSQTIAVTPGSLLEFQLEYPLTVKVGS